MPIRRWTGLLNWLIIVLTPSVALAADNQHSFLTFITNPNITYLLILVAIYGLFFELSNPGFLLPGIIGIISLLLVLYAFQLMPINYIGLTLLCIGIALMIFEVFMPNFGLIAAGGIIAFIMGSIMLFDLDNPDHHLSWILIFAMSFLSVAFFFMLLNLSLRAHKKAILTGKEGLIGSEGIVLSVMNEQVTVSVFGEIWNASSHIALRNGEKIKVTAVQGLTLTVEPLEKRSII